MNGVRRFLGGSAEPQSDAPPPLAVNTSPLALSGKQNRPPSVTKSPSQRRADSSSTRNSSIISPKTATPGLIIRKSDKQKQPPNPASLDDDVGNTSTQSGRSVSSSSSYMSHNRSQSSRVTPSPKRSQILMDSSGGGSPSSPHNRSLSAATSSSRRPPLPTSGSHIAGPSSSHGMPLRHHGESEGKRQSGLLNTRDELLMSLLASEAVVDSRDFEILSSEKVEDLKKEQQVLSSRLAAMTKKLTLEIKIRDAAVSLTKVNAPHKSVSKQTDEQLSAANRRVEAAQQEFWRVSERANEVHKKLLEHRASVLSFSVRSMEKKMAKSNGKADGEGSGYTSPSNQSAPMSPSGQSASSATSVSTSSKPRFDGAHLFAGHADALVPKQWRNPSAGDLSALEEKLKAATGALAAANKKQGDLARELSHLRLEKTQIETTMGMELQSAEETIATLQEEMPRLEARDAQLRDLQNGKAEWERARMTLKEREREIETLGRRLQVMEARSGEVTGMQTSLEEEKEYSRRELEQKEAEIQKLKAQWQADRRDWDKERSTLEDENLKTVAHLEEGLAALRTLVQTHGIVLFSRQTSLPGMVSSIGSHLAGLAGKMEGHGMVKVEWENARKKLEEEIKNGNERRKALYRDVEEVRRERDDARSEVKTLEGRLKDMEQPTRLSPKTPPTDFSGDNSRIISILMPIWTILPSPEARAAKFSGSRLRSNSPTNNKPGSPKPVSSLSELDVRSLKTLYDSKLLAYPPSPNPENAFTIEAFAQRVHALIADDRALIERLIRFAQAHDLLKKNAERAQKLAQESSSALETYQKQVNKLEERNLSMSSRQVELQDSVQQLQDTVDRITVEKHKIEEEAAQQAETCRQLADSNNTLSAKTLALAEEAATASDVVRRQLDETKKQLEDCKAALQKAHEEIDGMKMGEQDQRIALLDELNSMQTENGNLRAQLRSIKKSLDL